MSDDDEQVTQSERLTTRLKLRLHAKNLALVGLVKRKPDCWCVVTPVPSQEGQKLGETEVIEKSCNPQWTRAIWIDYQHGTTLYFKVNLLRNSNREGQKVVGTALFEVSDILGSNRSKVKRFPQGGVIIAQLRVMPADVDNHAVFRFRLRTMELQVRSSVFGSKKAVDTILELARMNVSETGSSWMVIYRSRPLLESSLPCWDEAEVNLDTESREELQWPVRLMIWDGKRTSLLGSVETTVHSILDRIIEEDFDEPSELDLVILRGGRDVGRLRVIQAKVVTSKQIDEEEDILSTTSEPFTPISQMLSNNSSNPAVLNRYIEGGGRINLCVAIDFTSSNGDPRRTESLHYILDENSNNDYQHVIGEIVSALDAFTFHEFPVWGFGAKFDGQVRHIFQCGSHPTTRGVGGIHEAYRSMFEQDIVMSGPTVFASVIQAAALRAKSSHVSSYPFCALSKSPLDEC